MTSLLSLNNVCIAFGLHNLLEHASFTISAGERVCLIGRNGSGKSTLLRIIDQEIRPDSGEVWRKPGLRIARLAQEPGFTDSATVFEVVAGGLDAVGNQLAEYHELAQSMAKNLSPDKLRRLEQVHHELDAHDGWTLQQRIEAILTRLQIPADRKISELSGGWRRRVDLARALVGEPELLLLDEPTNHLDIEAIQWLEDQMLAYRGALLFVTHDRALLQRLATRIVELDRGQLTSWSGDYRSFLEQKADALEVEARHQAKFDKRLAQEESWIRQGIKARRTRNEGRVRALKALRQERRQRREQIGRPGFGLTEAGASGQRVIEAENVSYAWQDRPLIKNFSVRILRGDHVGLIGPNGSGKTSLLQLLLGHLEPQTGHVRLGTRLEAAYFDQLRAQLDLEQTVLDNVSQGRETITLKGRSRHIISYLSEFMFTPERARAPVKSLSGGERNRLLLARLFSQPSNLLVMDEPTNDLDIETLELLEELLISYSGTLLLVSHDRAFLDNVVTSCLVFEGEGRVREYVGGYSDWLDQRQAGDVTSPSKSTETKPVEAKSQKRRPTVKLSYNQQRELEQLPAHIEAMEAEQARLQELSAGPELYRGHSSELTQVIEGLRKLEENLKIAYLRWEELENLKESET